MRYIGEGPREIYWQEHKTGKWHHALGNGQAFNSFEEAESDYLSKIKPGFLNTPIGCFFFLFVVFILRFIFG